jgi:hypothetical protein
MPLGQVGYSIHTIRDRVRAEELMPLGQVGYSIHTTRDRVRVEELILRESPWARLGSPFTPSATGSGWRSSS